MIMQYQIIFKINSKNYIDSADIFLPKNKLNKNINYFEIDINNLVLKKFL